MTDTKPMTGQPQKDLGESKKNQQNSGPEDDADTVPGWVADLYWKLMTPAQRDEANKRCGAVNRKHDPEREARNSGGVGDERNGRKEAAPRAEQAEGWRPMSDLPHEMGTVLVQNSIGCMAIVNMISATGMGYWMDDDGAHERISDLTGWMPPPAAAPALKPEGES